MDIKEMQCMVMELIFDMDYYNSFVIHPMLTDRAGRDEETWYRRC